MPSSVWIWSSLGLEQPMRCAACVILYFRTSGDGVDETSIRIKSQDRYLYRAVNSTGQAIDFLLTVKRDTAAANGFFHKTLLDPANPQPRVINVDKSRAYPAAGEELKSVGTQSRRCLLRQCKYLNNIIETIGFEKRVWLGRRYQSFPTAWWTSQGIEAVYMIRKGRVRRVVKGDPLAKLLFIDRLFELRI